jgi:ketosteroid isomerase-like protein
MKWSTYLLLGTVLAVGSLPSSNAMDGSRQEKSAVQTSALTDEVRKELLDARETAWRSFFQKDLAVVERILAPELIAIQENSEHWVNRTRMIAMAKAMKEQGVHLLRLEFPRTEIQLFGDTAILYYTYIFETEGSGKSAVEAGRGTEIFVRRDGKWLDVGWHLDNGAFSYANGEWTRAGEPLPAPSRTAPR